MFGKTVFGDAATASDASVARPVDMSPSQVPINAYAQTTMPVTQVDPTTLQVARFRGLPPPGTIIGVDPTKAINERIPQTVPITNVDPTTIPIRPLPPGEPGPGGPVTAEQIAWAQWQAKHYPGVFHRPEMVGPGRYAPPHRFGPPVLGSSPDGLGRYGRRH